MSDKVKALEAEIREQKANGTYTPPSTIKRGSFRLPKSARQSQRSRSLSSGFIKPMGERVSITPVVGESVSSSNNSTPTGAACKTPSKMWSTSLSEGMSTISAPGSGVTCSMGDGSPEKDSLSAWDGPLTSTRSLPVPSSLSWQSRERQHEMTLQPSAGKPKSIFTRIAAFLGFM